MTAGQGEQVDRAIPLAAVGAATVGRWRTGVVVAVIGAVALFAIASFVGRTYTAQATVEWGRLPAQYHNLVRDFYADINNAEAAFRDRLLEEAGFDVDCRVQGLAAGVPSLSLSCRATSPDAARERVDALGQFVQQHQARTFEIAFSEIDRDAAFLRRGIDGAQAQIDDLRSLEASPFEAVQKTSAMSSARARILDLERDLAAVEIRRLEIQPTTYLDNAQIVDTPAPTGLSLAVSGVVGVLLGIFAAVAFGMIDVVSRPAPERRRQMAP